MIFTKPDIDENSLGKYDFNTFDVMMRLMESAIVKNIRSKVGLSDYLLTAKSNETDIVDGLLSGGDTIHKTIWCWKSVSKGRSSSEKRTKRKTFELKLRE